MSKSNITQIVLFVTTFLSIFLTSCFEKSVGEKETKLKWRAEIVGRITSDEITESSGLANSPCQREILWTHNDSGDGAFIFAIDKRGNRLATFKVTNAKNEDWEDMAIMKDLSGNCYIYIADIGSNTKKRKLFTIYRVEEPKVSVNISSSKKNPIPTKPAEEIRFEYPSSSNDAEAMIVHPQTGDIYVLTKNLVEPSEVYRLKANASKQSVNRLEKVSNLKVPSIPNGFITGASISPDARRLVVCDYLGVYEFKLPSSSKDFDDIWSQQAEKIELPERLQGEAVAYSADGKSIFATSEQKNSPLIMIVRK